MSKALADEEVEALVCFASPNHTSKTRYTMPDDVPANFEFGLLEFADLRDLYQRADLVMLPLLYNRYSAGLSTLFEAIACGAPVVVTETPGIIAELVAEDLVVGVPAGDERAVRSAVAEVLANPDAAAERAVRARKVVLDRYSATSFLDLIEGLLVGVEAPVSAP
jgi:glycosyltransferase involved in cell wall biosynthesis